MFGAIRRVQTDQNFLELFDDLASTLQHRYDLINVFVGPKNSNLVRAQMNLVDVDLTIKDAIDASHELGAILFIVNRQEEFHENTIATNSTEVNAFALLMDKKQEYLDLEEKQDNSGPNKIYNCLLKYFEERNIRFKKDEIILSKYLTSQLTKALWTIDGHVHKFFEAPNVSPIPSCFLFNKEDKTFRKLDHKGKPKKSVPNLDSKELIDVSYKLEDLLSKKSFSTSKWKVVHDDVNALNQSLKTYVMYLNQKAENHEGPKEILSQCKFYEIPKNENINIFSKKTYEELQLVLAQENYVPHNIVKYAPLDRYRKYRYINGLVFPFTICVYRLSGRERGTFVWKVPNDKDNSHEQKNAEVIHIIETKLKFETKNEILQMVEKKYKNKIRSTQNIEECVEAICGKSLI